MEKEQGPEGRRREVLREIASIPTAPLHEERVARYVADFLKALGLRPQRDRFGNVVVCYRRGAGQPAPIALVAHMDHPALEIALAQAAWARATLLGGVDPDCFRSPVRVRLYNPDRSEVVIAETVDCDATEPRNVQLELRVTGPAARGDFGVFDLPCYQEKGDLVHLRAADDLAGCAAVLLTLEELVRRQTSAVVYGVFTRAEEIGLVGATLAAEAGTLPREAVVVSLEASKELPGALIGQGPVIRVGDRTRSFSPEAEAVLLAARARLQTEEPTRLVQRQLMSGGTCEATAFGLQGYRTTGVALPLGNYHNVGPDQTIAAEYVSFQDFSTEVDLLVTAADVATQSTASLWSRFAEAASRYRDRLAATADEFEP